MGLEALNAFNGRLNVSEVGKSLYMKKTQVSHHALKTASSFIRTQLRSGKVLTISSSP